MLENQIQEYIQKQSLQRLEEGVRLTLSRLDAIPATPPGRILALSADSMAKDVVLSPEEALWPLDVLALPSAESFLDVQTRTNAIMQRLEWASQHLSEFCSAPAIECNRDKVQKAFGFLYWPHNRERVEEVLNLFNELRPLPEQIPLPNLTTWERCLGLVGSGIASARSRYEKLGKHF